MTSVTTDRRLSVNSSQAVKVPCAVASTSNITLSGEQTIDGVLTSASRVLVTGQTDATENGIYLSDTGAWAREPDWDGVSDVVPGTIVRVVQGTSNYGYWAVTSPTSGSITPGTTSVTISHVDADGVLREDLANTTDLTKGFNLVYYPLTAAESAAGVTPVNYQYKEFDSRRYLTIVDGSTDNNTELQNWLDSAGNAYNGYEQVKAHFYPQGADHIFTALSVPQGVHVVGHGGVLKFKDSTAVASQAYYPIQNDTTNGNCTIENLIIDGNKANNTTFTVCDAITVGGPNVRVINNRIINPPDSGIMFSDTLRSRCEGNRISGAPDVGIYVNSSGSGNTEAAVITRNIITECLFGGIGIKRYMDKVIVTNNQIHDCGNGVTVEDFGSGNNPNRIIINDNYFEYIGYIEATAAKAGVTVQAAYNVTVSGNVFNDIETANVLLSGAHQSIVSNNQMYGTANGDNTANCGVKLIARTSNNVTDNQIKDNLIVDMQYIGIWHDNNIGGFDTGNVIDNNIVKNAGNDALQVDSQFTYGEITNNKLDAPDLTRYDINYNISNNTRTHNRVYGNELKNKTSNGNANVRTETYCFYEFQGKVSVGDIEPAIGTYEIGDKIWNTAPAAGTATDMGWVCTTAGTDGTLSGVTGSITTGTAALTVNSNADIYIGDYITIAGVTGIKKVTAVSGTTGVTIDSNADATVSGAAVAYSAPTFKGFGDVSA